MKRILIILLLLTMIFSSSVLYAEESSRENFILDETIQEYTDIIEQQGLKTVDTIPDGVIPYIVNTPEELMEIINDTKEILHTREVVLDDNIYARVSSRGTSSNYSVTLTDTYSSGFAKISFTSTLSITNWGSFRSITGNSEKTRATGLTNGAYWYQGNQDGTISNNGNSYSGESHGTLQAYLITPGGNIALKPKFVDLDNSYSLY